MKAALMFTILLWGALFSGCSSSDSDLHEGVITYKITFLDDKKDQPIIDMLPEKMSVLFKDNKTLTRIDGYLGIFSLSYLSVPDKGINYTIMRIIDKKYIYRAPAGKPAFGYADMGALKLRYLNETREIAGHLCNKAIASSPEMNYEPLVLYYTYEVDIEQPNANNPFGEVDGVLMQFQLRLENINMRMQATSVQHQAIDPSYFEPPSDCEELSYAQMQEIIHMFDNSDKNK